MACGCSSKRQKNNNSTELNKPNPECFVKVQIKEGSHSKYWANLTIPNFLLMREKNPSLIKNYILPDGVTLESLLEEEVVNHVPTSIIETENDLPPTTTFVDGNLMIVVNEPEGYNEEDINNLRIDELENDYINEELISNDQIIENNVENVEYISEENKTKKRKK